jgi:PTH1 family peptidyl-tRNA hydrolase
MHVVVGLGNPGQRYVETRHNVGFMVVDHISERWHIALGPTIKGVRLGRGCWSGLPVALVEPQRYMNMSGEALDAVRDELTDGGETHELIVIHDDIDLPYGQLRVKRGGGTGGHRGLESISAFYGFDFIRVRVGVDRPALGEEAAAHVLSPFSAAERPGLTGLIERAADAVEALLREGLQATMNRFNQRVPATARDN